MHVVRHVSIIALLVSALGIAPALAEPQPSRQVSTGKNLPKVDLNTSPDTALASLPGVGEAVAAKILAARPYRSVDELSKAGLTAAQVEKLRPFVSVIVLPPGAEVIDLKGGRAPEVKAIPVDHGGTQTVPVPAGTMRTIAVPKGTVRKADAQGKVASPTPGSPDNVGKMGGAADSKGGLVWVDSTKKVFYRNGSPSYGKVEPGIFMTEAAATRSGYKEAPKAAPEPTAKTAKPQTKKPAK